MDSVIDMTFSLSYRNEVLNFLLPLFPPLEAKASHVYAVTRILVTLSDPSLAIPTLSKLVPREKLLAYQLAFDLVEGGGQDFLVAIRTGLPEGDSVRLFIDFDYKYILNPIFRIQNPSTIISARFSPGKNL